MLIINERIKESQKSLDSAQNLDPDLYSAVYNLTEAVKLLQQENRELESRIEYAQNLITGGFHS